MVNVRTEDLERLGVEIRPDGRSGYAGKPGLKPSPKRNKYGAKPTDYKGRRYASKAEASRAMALDQLVEAGAIRGWEAQPSFELVQGFKYKPDFLVVGIDGVAWAEDVKGAITQRFRDCKRLWVAHGIMPLHVIFKDRKEVINPQWIEQSL